MKKILCVLLALVTVGAMLASCASEGTTDTQTSDTSAALDDTTEVTEPAEETMPPLDVPELDLNGEAVNIFVMPSSGWINQRDFTYSEETAGEPINDAAAERVRAVEELFNVDIVDVIAPSIGELTNLAMNELTAGGDAYDIIMPEMTSVNKLRASGLLCDLMSLDNLNLDMPWWNQSANRNLSLDGKLYFTLGDISLIDNDGVATIGFNKKLIEDYNLDSPYAYILDGTWTTDVMFEMASAVSGDLDGDGEMTASDLYGFVNDAQNLIYFLYGADIMLVEKDSNDMPVPGIVGERTDAVIDKYIALTNNKAVYAETTMFGGHEAANTNFMNDQMLFRQSSMFRFTQMRNMETDFGFATIPKLDESQDSYHHAYAYSSPCVALPITLDDPESVAAVLEALAYYGRKTMLPAYFDVTLLGKVARDNESEEVLELIFDTGEFDLGLLCNFGGMRDIWSVFVNSGENTFRSKYAEIESKVLTEIEAFIETY